MENRYESFIVKIHDGAGNPRGYIEHISCRERAYFDSLAPMNRFIMTHLSLHLATKEVEQHKNNETSR